MKIENHIKRNAINRPNDVFGSFVPIVQTFVNQQLQIAENYTHTVTKGKFRIFINKTFLLEFQNDAPIEIQECPCQISKVQQCPCSHLLYFIKQKQQLGNYDLLREQVNNDLYSISKYMEQMDLLKTSRYASNIIIQQRIQRDRIDLIDDLNFKAEQTCTSQELKEVLMRAFDEVELDQQILITNYAVMISNKQNLYFEKESKNIPEKFSRYKSAAELFK
ncbi:Hypothetical_protein [Hexamita inflata]|uniref:Hypothetical_protein n=1 Tax=Hexamita inflata TaxID=28002 RepID=A0ABP1HMT1_9EUKA